MTKQGVVSMRRLLAIVMFGLAALAAPATAQEWEKYEFSAQPLAEGLTWLRGPGGNVVACHGPDGVLLVDTDYQRMTEKLKGAVAALGAGPVKFVVNTHWHFDHVGGDSAFARDGALIIAHPNLRTRMERGQSITVIDETVAPAPAVALPRLTFTDSLTLHLNGETIEIRHPRRAHTDGDAVVRFRRADVIHAGDLWFHGGYPFVDVSSGGDIDGLIGAIDVIIAAAGDSTRIVPGHGPVGTKVDLAAHRAMLQEFRDIVAREIAAGKDLATIIAEKPTARLDEVWGKRMFPPEAFTEMVYRSLQRD
jgi:glyoxylase-like metal-dependent hydrolase (beta-lactamase superfamily II)